MLTFFQGDDTAANGRTVKVRLPDVDIGEGFEISLRMFGTERRGAYSPGGTLRFDWTRDETACFPLGVSYASAELWKEGLMQTITNTIPVRVTDSVVEALRAANGGTSGGEGNAIDIAVAVNRGVPRIDKAPLTKASSEGDIKALANAILDAINGSAAFAFALLFGCCTAMATDVTLDTVGGDDITGYTEVVTGVSVVESDPTVPAWAKSPDPPETADFSTNNTVLVETIETVAPPAVYATVSNAAMNAVQRREQREGFGPWLSGYLLDFSDDNSFVPQGTMYFLADDGKWYPITPSWVTSPSEGWYPTTVGTNIDLSAYIDTYSRPFDNRYARYAEWPLRDPLDPRFRMNNDEPGQFAGLYFGRWQYRALRTSDLINDGPPRDEYGGLEPDPYVTESRAVNGQALSADITLDAADVGALPNDATLAGIANFSNAVLAVGLNIDTNTVAAINALVEAGDELPIGGAAAVGGLLLALAAAVAALKRGKADAADVTALQDRVDDNADALEDKADKVGNAASGNFAGLDANGNLTDSGKKAGDFAPATNIAKTALASNVQTSLGKADTALQPVSGAKQNNIVVFGADGKVEDGGKTVAAVVSEAANAADSRGRYRIGYIYTVPRIAMSASLPAGWTLWLESEDGLDPTQVPVDRLMFDPSYGDRTTEPSPDGHWVIYPEKPTSPHWNRDGGVIYEWYEYARVTGFFFKDANGTEYREYDDWPSLVMSDYKNIVYGEDRRILTLSADYFLGFDVEDPIELRLPHEWSDENRASDGIIRIVLRAGQSAPSLLLPTMTDDGGETYRYRVHDGETLEIADGGENGSETLIYWTTIGYKTFMLATRTLEEA